MYSYNYTGYNIQMSAKWTFISQNEYCILIRHVILAWSQQSFAIAHMVCIVSLRVDCLAKWFLYKRLRRIIPQIPHKLHYISSLPEVPEETVRGGLSLIFNLIVILF